MRPASSRRDVTTPAPWRQTWQRAMSSPPVRAVGAPQTLQRASCPAANGMMSSARMALRSIDLPSVMACSGQAEAHTPQSTQAAGWKDRLKVPSCALKCRAPVGQKRAHSPQAEQALVSTCTAAKGVWAVANSPAWADSRCPNAANSLRWPSGTCCGRRVETGAPRWIQSSTCATSSVSAWLGRNRDKNERRLMAGWAPSKSGTRIAARVGGWRPFGVQKNRRRPACGVQQRTGSIC